MTLLKNLSLIVACTLMLFNTSCKKEDSSASSAEKPRVGTKPTENVGYYKALAGGGIISSGSSDVTSRGICWATHSEPTKSDNYLAEPVNLGDFQLLITGLTPGTKYYVAAYGENSHGITYGADDEFTTKVIPQPSCTPDANTFNYNGQPITFTSVKGSDRATFGNYAIEARGDYGTLTLEFKQEPITAAYSIVDRGSYNNEYDCSVRGQFGSIWSSITYYTNRGNTVHITKNGQDKYTVIFCDLKFVSMSGSFTSDCKLEVK